MSNSFKRCPTHFPGGARNVLGGASLPLRSPGYGAWKQCWSRTQRIDVSESQTNYSATKSSQSYCTTCI